MEEVRLAYAVHAQRYIDLFGATVHVNAHDLVFIERNLSMWPGVVLDVGCGPGHLTDHLRSLGVDASGLDVAMEFIKHAHAAYPDGRYVLGSMDQLPVRDRSVTGILAWYSLIHLPPDALDGVLAELRRVMVPAGKLLVGFFDGDWVEAFEHKVVTAWFWPVDELSERLRQAGFSEIERRRRAAQGGHRPHAAIAAIAR